MRTINTINKTGEIILRSQELGVDFLDMLKDELQVFIDDFLDRDDFIEISSRKNMFLLDGISFHKVRRMLLSKPKIVEGYDSLEYGIYQLTTAADTVPDGLLFYHIQMPLDYLSSYSYMIVKNASVTRRFFIDNILKTLD